MKQFMTYYNELSLIFFSLFLLRQTLIFFPPLFNMFMFDPIVHDTMVRVYQILQEVDRVCHLVLSSTIGRSVSRQVGSFAQGQNVTIFFVYEQIK